MFITTFGVMNVMIGLFCENVMEGALESERELKELHEEERKTRLKVLKDLFAALDFNDSGTVTRSEFMKALEEDESVVRCLEFLELHHDVDLFDVLDVDSSEELSFEEFFHGCMLLMRGNEPAKGKDSISTYLISQATMKMVQSSQDTL